MDAVFVTGGTGFIGASLVRLLIEKGFRVRALARKGSDRRNLEGLDLTVINGDLFDQSALARGCKNARYVFHLAADYRIWVRNPRDMYAANVDGTKNVIAEARSAGAERIVYCSSVACVKPAPGNIPASEDSHYGDVDDIVSPYKKSKYAAERLALETASAGAPVVVVNPSAPMGPYDIKPTPTGRIIVDFLNGRMPSYIDTGLNLIDVRDAARGHYLAALKGRVGQRYILGGENMTLKALLDLLGEITGLPSPRFKTPYPLAYFVGMLDTARAQVFNAEPLVPLDAVRMARQYMWFDHSKAERELGFKPSPIRRALADAVNWFRDNGYVKTAAAA